jgi:hypothetical protein
MPSMDDLFKGRHFDREIVILRMRGCLRFKPGFRDLVEMMAERGLSLVHAIIMRWIQRYVPEFEKRRSRFARQAGGAVAAIMSVLSRCRVQANSLARVRRQDKSCRFHPIAPFSTNGPSDPMRSPMTTDAAARLAILADAPTEIVDLATGGEKNVLAPLAEVLARAGDIAREALVVTGACRRFWRSPRRARTRRFAIRRRRRDGALTVY